MLFLDCLMNNSSVLNVSQDSAFASGKDYHNIFQKKKIISVRKSSLYSLSLDIVETFTQCNKDFRAIEKLPQRILDIQPWHNRLLLLLKAYP